MTTPVVFGAKAHADILALYDFIAERDGADRAAAYLKQIETFCRSLGTVPLRGSRRDDIRPGIRIVGFERRVSIAFRVQTDRVSILRVLYGGRDLTRAFPKDRDR